ncbi:hypothetical protein CN998_01530 [Bacillus cereus]|nr:hypothetical protein CN998_01530 [Bacillus cereus]PGU50712.1 hypothetical protein COD70_29270 [Bacillus cereus]
MDKKYIKGDVHNPNYKGHWRTEYFEQRETYKEGLEGFAAEEKSLQERKEAFEREQKQQLAELHTKAMYEINNKEIDFVDDKKDIPVFEKETEYQIAESNYTFMQVAEKGEYTRSERDNITSVYNVLKAERDAFTSQYPLMTREEASGLYGEALQKSKVNEEVRGEEKLFPIVDTRSHEEMMEDVFNESIE